MPVTFRKQDTGMKRGYFMPVPCSVQLGFGQLFMA